MAERRGNSGDFAEQTQLLKTCSFILRAVDFSRYKNRGPLGNTNLISTSQGRAGKATIFLFA
jgi:hypothetical protein